MSQKSAADSKKRLQLTLEEREAWEGFRAALNGLFLVDRERARLYLQNATPSIESWTRAVQKRKEH